MNWLVSREISKITGKDKKMHNFKVGGYVWYIDSEKPTVKHYLVVEEIVKNSVNGQSREYIFEAVTPSGKAGKVSSNVLKGNFFQERKAVFDFMLEQASEAINSMLNRAERKPEVEPDMASESVEPEISNTKLEEEGTIVELPDGRIARLKGGSPWENPNET